MNTNSGEEKRKSPMSSMMAVATLLALSGAHLVPVSDGEDIVRKPRPARKPAEAPSETGLFSRAERRRAEKAKRKEQE